MLGKIKIDIKKHPLSNGKIAYSKTLHKTAGGENKYNQTEIVKACKTNILLNHINRFKQMPNCDSA